MQLSMDRDGDVTVVTVGVEELAAGNADDFLRGVTPVLDGSRKLVLDMGRVQFMDSRGCGTILTCVKRVARAGGELKVCGGTPPGRSVFDLVRLRRVCVIVGTREEALKAFQG